MSGWLEVLMILVTYCGGNTTPRMLEPDKCRLDRMACMKRAVERAPKANAEDLVNVCLASPNSFNEPVPTPIASPAPQSKKESPKK